MHLNQNESLFHHAGLLFLLPFPLLAQTPSPTSAPAAAPAFPPLAHGEKLHITGIPNAGKITETLYRGAQPREVGLSELKILASPPSSTSAARIATKSRGTQAR